MNTSWYVGEAATPAEEIERLNDAVRRVVAFRNIAMGWTEQLRTALTALADRADGYLAIPTRDGLRDLNAAIGDARAALEKLPPPLAEHTKPGEEDDV